MFTLNKYQKIEIERIGREYGLKLLLVYGSFVRNTARLESDLDIAVLGAKEVSFDLLLEIYNRLSDIFKDKKEIDVKSLHHSDMLFRYYVMRDGILLYGNITDYNQYKSYAFRAYRDSRDLLRLEEILVDKRIKSLQEAFK